MLDADNGEVFLKSWRFLAVSALLAGMIALGQHPVAAQPDYASIGRSTALALVQGHWSSVEADFDSRMKAALPADKLAMAWQQNTAEAGTFEQIRAVNVTEKKGYHIAVVTCDFSRGSINVKPVMDSQGHIAGLFFAPAAPAPSASASQPDYAAIGRETVTGLAHSQFTAVESRFDYRMKSALPAGKLDATWQQIIARAGRFERMDGVQLSEQDGYHIALVDCVYTNARLEAKVVLDPNGQIAGLFFVPSGQSR